MDFKILLSSGAEEVFARKMLLSSGPEMGVVYKMLLSYAPEDPLVLTNPCSSGAEEVCSSKMLLSYGAAEGFGDAGTHLSRAEEGVVYVAEPFSGATEG